MSAKTLKILKMIWICFKEWFMKVSSLVRGLLFMVGGQIALSAMGVYSPSLWFVAGWVLCLIDHMLETNSLRW